MRKILYLFILGVYSGDYGGDPFSRFPRGAFRRKQFSSKKKSDLKFRLKNRNFVKNKKSSKNRSFG